MWPMSSTLYGHRCVVCGRAVSDAREYGGRQYCDAHLAEFAEDVPPVWRASVLTFGLILILIVALAIANAVLPGELANKARFATSVVIALLPALTWLVLLYRTASRAQIELSTLLPTIFVLSVLLAAAATRPLLFDLIDLDTWLVSVNARNRFLGNILIGGFFHTFVLYAIVRYTVWHTPTFTRRVHGVLFELAAGWGYASTLNLLFVLDQGGLSLLNGGLKLIAQLCAYLAPSLILGYFLGRNRFEDMPFHYLSMGLVLSAAINGLLLYAGTELNNIRLGVDQDGFSPWPGLVFSIVALLLTFGAIYGLLTRHNNLTKARLEPKA